MLSTSTGNREVQDFTMENAPEENQEAAPRGKGRLPTHVDQRIDQLTQIVGTSVNTFQNWVTNNRGNQPQQGNPVDLVGVNGANRCQKTQTEGTRETDGHQQEAYTSRTRTQGSMGGRQMRALRRAQEREATAISPRRVGKRQGLPPRRTKRDIVHGESTSVQNQRDLRERLQTHRANSSQLTKGTLTASKVREIR